MAYRIQLFAALRERTGKSTWDLPRQEPLRGSDVLRLFFEAHPEVAGLQPVTRLAVNQAFCHDDPELQPSDELALIPPVSGG